MEEYPGLTSAIQYSTEQQQSSQKGKRKQVGRACSQCAAAHVACSEHRPCTRCSKRGIQCLDRERKRRRRAEPDEDDGPMVASTAGSFMPHHHGLLPSHLMPGQHPMYSLPPMPGTHFPEYGHLPEFFPRILDDNRRMNHDLSGFKQEGRYSPPDIYSGGGHMGIDTHFQFGHHYFPPPDDYPVPTSGLPLGEPNPYLGGMGQFGLSGMGHFSGLNPLENIHPLPGINNFSSFGFKSSGLSPLDNQMSIPPPLIIPSNRVSTDGPGLGFPDFPPHHSSSNSLPPHSSILPNRVSSPTFVSATTPKLPPMPAVDFPNFNPPSFIPAITPLSHTHTQNHANLSSLSLPPLAPSQRVASPSEGDEVSDLESSKQETNQ